MSELVRMGGSARDGGLLLKPERARMSDLVRLRREPMHSHHANLSGEGRMRRGVEFNTRGAARVAEAYAKAGIKKSCRLALAPNTPAVS